MKQRRTSKPPTKSHPWRAGYTRTVWKKTQAEKKKQIVLEKLESIPTKRNISG